MPIDTMQTFEGKLKAGRNGFFLEAARGVRWVLEVDEDARDFLGANIVVEGCKQPSGRIAVRSYKAVPMVGTNSTRATTIAIKLAL